MDYVHPNTHGYPSSAPHPSARDQHDPRIDECGNIHSRVIQTLSILSDTPITSFQKHNQQPTTIDYNILKLNFGWVNADTIKKTFENSTQWAVTPTRFPLRKHFKSRFPAFNIPHRNEAVATDTIFSDTPAIDSGVTMAQTFVGKDSLVSHVYPMQSSKQFVNTLEDNISFRAAMNKLISDYAQVEISNKVKISSECITAVVGILNLIIKIRILLICAIGPSRHGPTKSSIGLDHLPTAGYSP